MGVKFTAASIQSVICSEPKLTTRPFTIACWYNAPIGGEQVLTVVRDTAATQRGWEFYCHSDDITTRLTWWTGTATQGTATATSTRGEWNFAVARLIGQSSKRIANLYPGGISHGNSTTSTSPVALNTVEIGGWDGVVNFDGVIAEWWMADIDVQPDGGQMSDNLLRQLAYKGPFSVPHVASAVVEYRSFWQGIGSNEDRAGHVYQKGGRRLFTAVNGPTIGEHPPLAPDYVRPGPYLKPRVLVV